MWITLGTIGNHVFTVEVETAEGEAHFALALEAMDAEQPVRGHIEIRPGDGVRLAIRLGDIVSAELSETQPPTEEKA